MRLTVQEVPVVNTVFDVTIVLENLGEQLSKEVVIRRLFEPEFPDVIQINRELLCALVSPGPGPE